MTAHVAFLRGINLGGRRLTMDALRAHFASFGLEDAETYRASGNVVFDHSGDAVPTLEGAIEEHLETALGYEVRTFVRALADLERLVALDAVASARDEGFTPYVIFCRSEPDAGVREALGGLETPEDRFRAVAGDVLYLRRGRVSDSPVEPHHLEEVLGGADWSRRKLTTVEGIVRKFRPPDARAGP